MDALARETLVKLVEEHMTCLVREAISVERHTKRARIIGISNNNTDPTAASTLLSSSLLGVSNGNNKGFESTVAASLLSSCTTTTSNSRINGTDINIALQLMGSEKLYGSSLYRYNAANSSLSTTRGGGGGGYIGANEVQYDSNKKVMLLEFLQSEELPPAPTEIELKYHWLAVDGVQPQTPQNPAGLVDPHYHQPVVIVSDTEGSSTVVGANDGIVTLPHNNSNSISTTNGGFGSGGSGVGGTLRVNQLQASLLSEELKLYFTRVTNAIENAGYDQQDAALVSVASDPGLQELVPFFVRYCQKELFLYMNYPSSAPTAITTAGNRYHQLYIDHADHCRTLVRLVRSLLHNPHLHLELHLHELLPALVSCVVAEKLCQPPPSSPYGTGTGTTPSSTSSTTANYHHTHWILRREAATALYEACQLFHSEYPTLKSRILRALCQAIVTTTPTTSSKRKANRIIKKQQDLNLARQYGGIIGITMFGTRSIDTFLLPYILSNWEEWDTIIQDTTTSSSSSSSAATPSGQKLLYEVHMCQQACIDALGIYFKNVTIEEQSLRLSWENDIESIFYDRLIPYITEPNVYTTCFI